MSGGGSGNTQTIEKSDPWGGQQPYLLDIFKRAQEQFNAPGPSYFPGSTVAQRDPATIEALRQMRESVAPNQQNLATSAASGLNFAMMAPDVKNNPYAQGAIQSAINPAVRAFTDPGGIMQNLRSEFGSADQYGGTRHALALGTASDRLQQNILDTTARMSGDFYNQGLTAQGRALALAPQIQGMQATPSTTLGLVGTAEEAYKQQLIDEEIKKWNFEQNLPAAKLAQYQQMVQGGYGRESVTQTPSTRLNPWLAAGGGAAAGAAAGAATGASSGGYYGAAIGAIIGLLASR